MKSILQMMIRAYQYAISPLLGKRCRFEPSCSSYAHQAIQEHGAWTGSVMALKRIAKCHPFHAGGYDPVQKIRKNHG